MHADLPLVTIQQEGPHVTAWANGPSLPHTADDVPEREHGYSHLTTPLRRRGLECTIEYGLSDYIIHAQLPDESSLIISPPQEPPTEHPPGYPESWLVTRSHPDDSAVHEVVYDSEPDGPHAQHGGSVPSVLAAIDARLDQLGLPPRPEPKRFAQESVADEVLHRAGFVPAVVFGEHYHRLPSAMTDPAEQRRAVTRAFAMLQSEGFEVSCDPVLLDSGLSPSRAYEMGLGDRLGHLAQSIQASTHTSEVVASLSELTAPADGVLQRVVEILDTTAEWWEGFGDTADRHYADRLRYLAEQLDSYAIEVRAIRGDLADRHTARPDTAQVRAAQAAPPTASSSRVSVALSLSPTAAQRTVPAHLPAASASRPALLSTRPPSVPGR
ncbi:hypothetical protein ACFWP5_25045 [Streptomyces sp. NPDC058469]|uniref:hypothetical protein n=1 Tax=Streptomyces sp. NPDC058469 TaxID=3346514 RepID=UPI00364FC4D5